MSKGCLKQNNFYNCISVFMKSIEKTVKTRFDTLRWKKDINKICCRSTRSNLKPRRIIVEKDTQYRMLVSLVLQRTFSSRYRCILANSIVKHFTSCTKCSQDAATPSIIYQWFFHCKYNTSIKQFQHYAKYTLENIYMSIYTNKLLLINIWIVYNKYVLCINVT